MALGRYLMRRHRGQMRYLQIALVPLLVIAAFSVVRRSRSFSAREAVAAHVIDAVASSRADLLAGVDGRTLVRLDGRRDRIHVASGAIDVVDPTYRERLLMAIGHPMIAYFLLMGGLVGLAVELLHPGLVVPGVAGAIATAASIWSTGAIGATVAAGRCDLAIVVSATNLATFLVLTPVETSLQRRREHAQADRKRPS